jgi:glycosyltransferase involved in cell wall biosynthesis
MRIAYLATSMKLGGAEVQALSLAQQMRARGHEAIFISLVPVGPIVDEAKRVGVPAQSLGMRPGIPDPRAMLRLARILRSWKPDVLHSHMVHANLLARVVRPLTRIPVLISTVHNIDEGGALRMGGYRLTHSLADLTTIISHAAAERYVRIKAVPQGELRVIPNGVDTTSFSHRPEWRTAIRAGLGITDEFLWLAVGRFESAKDYPNMLAAFSKVLPKHPKTVLAIAGGGPGKEVMEQLAAELGLGEAVRFLGLRRDVPGLMSAADGYVMSSAWEGLPMVLLEAASSCLPVVATDVGGNKEVVLDGESGFLVPSRNSDALANTMVRLMELSVPERKTMGARGRAYVCEHYGLARIVDTWETIYRELLTGAGREKSPGAGGQR